MWLYKWRAQLTYWLARRLFTKKWAINNDRLWEWMQGQFARMAAFEDVAARSFYGHLLLHKGSGQAARNEGLRLLALAANAGDAKSSYQLGVHAMRLEQETMADPLQAARWLELSLEQGHPLAADRLLQLYADDGPPQTKNPAQAERVRQLNQFL